eukprot:4953263-Ditylum_brightwellii.AAC.1
MLQTHFTALPLKDKLQILTDGDMEGMKEQKEHHWNIKIRSSNSTLVESTISLVGGSSKITAAIEKKHHDSNFKASKGGRKEGADNILKGYEG